MSKLSDDLIVNGVIKYTAGTNLTAAVQPRLLYSGTITGTTGFSPTFTNPGNLAYRVDLAGTVIRIPSGYSRLQCVVCNANGTSSGNTFLTTPFIYNAANGNYVAGAVMYNVNNNVPYRLNYLIYGTIDQS
jgi:hypothetical protein